MNANEKLITKFYTCFQNKDYKGMQACYTDDATFSDAVFVNLDAKQVRAMWEMLLRTGKDLALEFKDVSANEIKGGATWIATYTFSRSGNKVVNFIKAEFLFESGKIKKHTDHFNFYTWARQALGMTGVLLGWTSFLKQKIRDTAAKNLKEFMEKNK